MFVLLLYLKCYNGLFYQVISTETSLQPINLLSYFIEYNYTHTQGNYTESSPLLIDSFLQLSTETSYNIPVDIDPPTFIVEGELDTKVKVCIRITEQCGQTVPEMKFLCNSSDSGNIA